MTSEASIKSAISDYLEIGQAQGKWLYLRLNAGSFILTDEAGNFRRRVQGVKAGTADFVVFQGANVQGIYRAIIKSPLIPICLVTFIECKSSKGKQSQAQKDFEQAVLKQNCRYFVIRDADEIPEVLR